MINDHEIARILEHVTNHKTRTWSELTQGLTVRGIEVLTYVRDNLYVQRVDNRWRLTTTGKEHLRKDYFK